MAVLDDAYPGSSKMMPRMIFEIHHYSVVVRVKTLNHLERLSYAFYENEFGVH